MVDSSSPLTIIGSGLWMAFYMFWEMLWALLLGFSISAAIQAVVSKGEVARLLPDHSPKSLLKACGLGAASSSCSYAATAIARSLFRKGADFTSSIAFEFASTNLVIELGIVLWVLIGWQFTVAEFIGGFVMIGILALLFRIFLRKRMVADARTQANRGLAGSMEGHAAMDMSLKSGGSLWKRVTSPKGYTAITHYFYMDFLSLWKDVALGLIISGFLAVLVPQTAWQALFYTGHGASSSIVGAFVGPIVSFLSFVCSVGNVPLAAVLWNGGISFGGVIAFIFADLLIIPILNIYRKYYGWKMMLFLFVTSYIAMAIAGLIVEGIFNALGLIPTAHPFVAMNAAISWNYTTVLDIIFIAVAGLFLLRFLKTGGPAMMKMMDMTEEEMMHGHDHQHEHPATPSASGAEFANDPVCGMKVDPKSAQHTATFEGKTYYFCCGGCKSKFESDPAAYMHKHETMEHSVHGAIEYSCPMHPEIVQNFPGRCPECGMMLLPKSLPIAM